MYAKIRPDANLKASMICALPKELDWANATDIRVQTRATMEWVQQHVPGKVERTQLHWDESRPYVHVLVRPVDYTGKLNWRAHFHGRHTWTVNAPSRVALVSNGFLWLFGDETVRCARPRRPERSVRTSGRS